MRSTICSRWQTPPGFAAMFAVEIVLKTGGANTLAMMSRSVEAVGVEHLGGDIQALVVAGEHGFAS